MLKKGNFGLKYACKCVMIVKLKKKRKNNEMETWIIQIHCLLKNGIVTAK